MVNRHPALLTALPALDQHSDVLGHHLLALDLPLSQQCEHEQGSEGVSVVQAFTCSESTHQCINQWEDAAAQISYCEHSFCCVHVDINLPFLVLCHSRSSVPGSYRGGESRPRTFRKITASTSS